MLGGVGNTLFLNKTCHIDHILKMLCLVKLFKKIEKHFTVAVSTLLMGIEHLGGKPHILFLGKGTNSVGRGQRFKPEFTAKARHTLTVIV